MFVRSVGLLMVVVLVGNSLVMAQADSTSLWSKTFGGADDEVASHIVVRRDGSIAINAQKTIFKDDSRNVFKSQSDAWLFSLDELGKLQWEQTLGGGGSETFYTFAVTENSGLLMAGVTNSDVDKTAVWAVNTDSGGQVLVRKVIPAEDDISVNGGICLEGKLIVCGEEWGGLEKKWQGFVMALHDDFSVQWKRSIGGNEFDVLNSIVATEEGNLIALGRIGTANGFQDVLLKLDPQGNEIWQKRLSQVKGHYRTKITATNEGGFTVFGRRSLDEMNALWIENFDSSGAMQWESIIPSDHDDSISSAITLTAGGYLVAGSRETQFPDERRKFNATLLRLTAEGGVVWQRSFPASGHTSINGLTQLNKNVAAGVGSVVDATTKNADAWVLMFTLDGDFPETVRVEQD